MTKNIEQLSPFEARFRRFGSHKTKRSSEARRQRRVIKAMKKGRWHAATVVKGTP